MYVFRISCKDLKSMLCQVNYRVPNMRFLREKLPVTSFYLSQTSPHFSLHLPAHFPSTVMLLKTFSGFNSRSAFPVVLQDSELRNGDVSFSQFAQLYRSLMFDAQKNVSAVIFIYAEILWSESFHPPPAHLMPCQGTIPLPICLFSNGCKINMDQ